MAKSYSCRIYSNVLKKWVPARFERFEKKDIPMLAMEDWDLPFNNDFHSENVNVYKLITSDKPKRTEGIISFRVVKGFVHIINIEKYRWRTNRDYKQTGICLIALACLFSMKNELKGNITLDPKDKKRIFDYYTGIGLEFVPLHQRFVIKQIELAKEFINKHQVHG